MCPDLKPEAVEKVMSEPLMRVSELSKSYAGKQVLRSVSFAVHRGEVKAIIGPSGAGKSTLLRCLNGLAPVDTGSIRFEGVEITDPKTNLDNVRTKIGFVFQDFNLFTHLTALDNVRIGLIKVKRLRKQEATDISARQLERVGLGDKLGSYPAELSGGQQQRASIARALAMQPDVMLFDEPTSALDPESVGGVLDVMEELAQDGMTMLVVSHEMGFVAASASDVIFMVEGAIVEEGRARELLDNPQHERTREFLNQSYRGHRAQGGE